LEFTKEDADLPVQTFGCGDEDQQEEAKENEEQIKPDPFYNQP